MASDRHWRSRAFGDGFTEAFHEQGLFKTGRTRRRPLCPVGAAIAACALLSACGGHMSTLSPADPSGTSIAATWWSMLIGGVALWMAMLVLAGWTFRRKTQRLGWRGARRLIVGGGIVLPTTVIAAFLAWGLPV